MFKLTFIGTGSAFNTKDLQSNMIIEANGKKLLIDCGSFAPMALEAVGIHGGNVGDEIDAVYISHLHADHIGGMEWLAFCTYFNPSVPRPKLLAVKSVMSEMWNNSLKGGLESIEGKVCTLTEFFDCIPLGTNQWFTWQGIEFMPIQTLHIMAGYQFMNSYGLLIKTGRKSKTITDGSGEPVDECVFLTTDTQFCPAQLKHFYGQAQIIFHDCETSANKSGVHAHLAELETLDDVTKKKMWLYHYNPGEKPDALQRGFAGYVEKGQTFEFPAVLDAAESE